MSGAGTQGGRDALSLFTARPRVLAVRDAQVLMAHPFFSLSKSRRVQPIDYHVGDVCVRVEGTHEHGLATIWDADVLLWAMSQWVEARDTGAETSRRLAAMPYQILTFTGRGTSLRDYLRLRAAFDRLQSTSIATSIRHIDHRRLHRFSWLHEWTEHADGDGRAIGVELILPAWLFAESLDPASILTLDPRYFALTGGIERWLYRTIRKHAGRQVSGWQFDVRHLYRKSGSLARFSDFLFDLRQIVRRQRLPGYRVQLAGEQLVFYPLVPPMVPVHNPVD